MRSIIRGLAGWTKNSFIDFPGTVSTVLFFSGCNLRCPYCHNCSLLKDPQDMSGRSEEVWDYLAKRRNLIEGVVFTGGEPTLHECVPQIMREAGNMGYKTLLDTNGLLPDVIERCSPDYLALDIKTEPSLYASLLGAQYPDVEQRLSHALDIVRRMGAHAEVRITVAPGIVTEERVRNLRPLLQGVEKVFLQPLSLKNMVLNPEFFETLPMYPSEMVVLFQQILAPVVGKCSIRNQ